MQNEKTQKKTSILLVYFDSSEHSHRYAFGVFLQRDFNPFISSFIPTEPFQFPLWLPLDFLFLSSSIRQYQY